MKDLLHVIVGAGVLPYLENAVSSVLTQSSDDVLAIYNQVDQADKIPSDSWLFSMKEPRLKVWERKNTLNLKTGALYSAYNEAILHAADRY